MGNCVVQKLNLEEGRHVDEKSTPDQDRTGI